MDKPLATLWRNYCQSTKPDIEMRVTVAVSGLKATTREHGLTEYWSHRITYAFAHPSYPKVRESRRSECVTGVDLEVLLDRAEERRQLIHCEVLVKLMFVSVRMLFRR